MKLLFDENLSARLPSKLAGCYPGSQHVREVGLKSAPDSAVWDYAGRYALAIVTKDANLRQRSFLYGHPPKVIWLRIGNCSTKRIESLLRDRVAEVAEFLEDDRKALLALSKNSRSGGRARPFTG